MTRVCTKCEVTKNLIEFSKDSAKATPAWAELEEIKQFYKNCPRGHHVDHQVPLCGKNVSGLHVLANLQYLTASENCRKGNKFSA